MRDFTEFEEWAEFQWIPKVRMHSLLHPNPYAGPWKLTQCVAGARTVQDTKCEVK